MSCDLSGWHTGKHNNYYSYKHDVTCGKGWIYSLESLKVWYGGGCGLSLVCINFKDASSNLHEC